MGFVSKGKNYFLYEQIISHKIKNKKINSVLLLEKPENQRNFQKMKTKLCKYLYSRGNL